MNFSDNVIVKTQLPKIDRLIVVNEIKIIFNIISSSSNSPIEKAIRINVTTENEANIYFDSLEEFSDNFTNVYQILFLEVSIIYKFDVKPSPDDIISLIYFEKDHASDKYYIRVSLSSKSKTFNEDVLISIKNRLEDQFPPDSNKIEPPLNVQITTSPEERKYKSYASSIDNKIRLWHLILGCILTAFLTYIVEKLLK